MSYMIRPAVEADAPEAYKLVRQLAIHEGLDDYMQIDEATFTNAAFGDNPQFSILLAELDGVIAGVVTYFRRFHIWFGENLIEIDDLFVSPDARGHGIGKKLLLAIGQLGKSENVHVKWTITTDSVRTIHMYRRMGVDYNPRGLCLWAPKDIPDTID
ncbi:GNAT family N-acetyltransferase [Kordiimonas aquimaris]|uniref:GNAT family N-acetyltransferase n=1 Tax=Kordiimonas aquimaris TaxID=707591 RepID=UPI0021CFF2F2|nr:GNAT family N-acetyltransferase [Kordiimonas aquimaris]